MRWLITGGCGFLGANVADHCLMRGEEVAILDNLSRVGSSENLNWLRARHGQNWRMVQEDIRNADGVARLIAELKPDVIAHLAGQVAMTTSLADPRLDFEVNATGSLNVLESVRVHSSESIVLYSSTNKVYGDLEWVQYIETPTRYVVPKFPEGFDESTPLNFESPYGCSKGCADQYMLDYARMFDVRTVVFRHSSMYGGRQFATYDQGWVGWFCMQALQTARMPDGHTFTISGNGKQVRDVLHVDDLVRLYLGAVMRIDQITGHVFNIGGGMGQSLSILELLQHLDNMLNVKLSPQRLPARASDQKVFVAKIAKARDLLGWEPRIHAHAGIAKMLEWLQAEVQP